MKYQYQSLVEKAKMGDKQAMEQLIKNMEPLIYSAICRYGRGEDREDLYQEACLLLIQSVYSYDSNRGVPFLIYIKSRIYYGIFNQTRNKTPHISIDEPLEEGRTETLGDILEDAQARVEEKIVQIEEKRRLMEALNCLSQKQRQVIELHYFSGMKLKDVSKKRGVHYKGILRLKERALKTLADILNKEVSF